MLQAILTAVLSVFAIMGICDVILFIRLLVSSPERYFESSVFVALEEDIYIGQLNLLLQKKHWYGDAFCSHIIAFTDALSDYQISEIKRIYKFEDIVFINSKDSGEVLWEVLTAKVGQ